ncbi:hypothetical protein AB4Y42_39220 [Paraburkholderia sp. EG286B]|uniref:hypothetical protein n=1 Tax=Paraburkholderia sp. EG286B TaxID=3237011 RepID=UPI0034D356AA
MNVVHAIVHMASQQRAAGESVFDQRHARGAAGQLMHREAFRHVLAKTDPRVKGLFNRTEFTMNIGNVHGGWASRVVSMDDARAIQRPRPLDTAVTLYSCVPM